ncbi:unnamed protein product [Chrysoparadoxa australica]
MNEADTSYVPVLDKRVILARIGQDPALKKQALISRALKPLMTDPDMIKAFLAYGGEDHAMISADELAVMGVVLAEVDTWHLKVKALLSKEQGQADKAWGAKTTKAKQSRQKRQEKGASPNPKDEWKKKLKTARVINRGDGKEWERFHHHVLIRIKDELPLYCCLCRRRKWEQRRKERLVLEYNWREGWANELEERQEVLESFFRTAVVGCLIHVQAQGDAKLQGALAALDGLLAAVPIRCEALQVVEQVLDDLVDAVLQQELTINERTKHRKEEALGRLKALKAFAAVPAWGKEAGAFEADPHGGGHDAATVASGAAGSVGRDSHSSGGSRGSRGSHEKWKKVKVAVTLSHAGLLAKFGRKANSDEGPKTPRKISPQAQEAALFYYNLPREEMQQLVHAAKSWQALADMWLKSEEEATDHQKHLLLDAVVTEMVGTEQAIWEKEEKERKAMVREEEMQLRHAEGLCRAVEAQPRSVQEAGHQHFCATIDKALRPHPNLQRLRWEYTADLGDTQDLTTRVRDAATNKRFICRFIPYTTDEELQYLLQETERLQDVRHPRLVKVRGAYPHRIMLHSLTGDVATEWSMVAVLVEFCAGGRLQDRLAELPEDQAGPQMENWVRGIANGLAAFHKWGGVHRNINEGNIYLDEKGRAKVGSYQCLKCSSPPGAKDMRTDYGAHSVHPPEYEQVGKIGPAGDMWALGCCLFKWMTGHSYARYSSLQVALQQVPLRYGPKVQEALRMCLQPDPQVRATAMELWKFMSIL